MSDQETVLIRHNRMYTSEFNLIPEQPKELKYLKIFFEKCTAVVREETTERQCILSLQEGKEDHLPLAAEWH